MNQKMIPFGKYQGKPVEILENDPQYVDWLMTQDWFRSKHKTIYNIVINKFGEPEETPDHNRIQAMFLSEEFRAKFACCVLAKKSITESLLRKRISETDIDEMNSRLKEMDYSSPEKSNLSRKIEDRIYFLEQFKKAKSIVACQNVEFEKNAVDCSFFAVIPFFAIDLKIEIKPVIGDDYPAVLRQMRSNKSKYLLFENFSAAGVSLETMVKFFESQEIFIFSLGEIENAEIFKFPFDLPVFA